MSAASRDIYMIVYINIINNMFSMKKWQVVVVALLNMTRQSGHFVLLYMFYIACKHLALILAELTGDNKVFCLVFVDDVSVPIARSPVRDSRSKDYWQHCPGHLPSSVHVCCYWSPVV